MIIDPLLLGTSQDTVALLVPAIAETPVTTSGTDDTGVNEELVLEKLLVPEEETEAIVNT